MLTITRILKKAQTEQEIVNTKLVNERLDRI